MAESDAASAAETLSPVDTPSVAERIASVKARLAVIRKKKRPSKAVRAKVMAEAEEQIWAEVALVERELSALVNAPLSGERDPFEWLPDELIVMIMLMLPFEVLWSGACERVCLRWSRLMESAPVTRRKREGRWAAYEAGLIKPRDLEGHNEGVCALAVGLDGKVYSGSNDMTIRVWSGTDGTHIQTLVGHTGWVSALAMGLDGKVYSGSSDKTIRVWSGTDGTHLQTLAGHTRCVSAVAVGLDGKVYSGSYDHTIRVWRGTDGRHLQTLVGHTGWVWALAVGLNGKVYSGSADKTIRVWSGDNGSHLQTLVGHTNSVCALAVGLNGKVYSGSSDTTIRVWSGEDGTHLQTLVGHTRSVCALAVGPDGKVYSGSYDGTIRVWSGDAWALLHKIFDDASCCARSVAIGRDGSLFSCSDDCISATRMLMW
jgi:hypothetical protein